MSVTQLTVRDSTVTAACALGELALLLPLQQSNLVLAMGLQMGFWVRPL